MVSHTWMFGLSASARIPKPLIGLVPLEPNDHRLGCAELISRLENAESYLFTGGDASIHIDEHGFHLGVGENDLKAFAHDLRGGSPADVEEVRGLHTGALFLARECDGVEGAHHQARPGCR